jgi:hypothetical protein
MLHAPAKRLIGTAPSAGIRTLAGGRFATGVRCMLLVSKIILSAIYEFLLCGPQHRVAGAFAEPCCRPQAQKPIMVGGGMGMMATGMMGGMRSNFGGDGSYMVRHAYGMLVVVGVLLVHKRGCFTAVLQHMVTVDLHIDPLRIAQGGNMGMGGMGAMGMGGMGAHSMGMANMGNMSPQMAEMGSMVRALAAIAVMCVAVDVGNVPAACHTAVCFTGCFAPCRG